MPAGTEPERVALDDAEIERLLAIERAARVYFREFDHLIGDQDYPERSDLWHALREKA